MNTTEATAWPSMCALSAKSRNHIDQAPIITTECPSIQLLISASQVPNFARISECCQPFPLMKYFSVNKIRIYLRSWSEQNTLNILSKLWWKSQSFGHLNSLLSITAAIKNPACLHTPNSCCWYLRFVIFLFLGIWLCSLRQQCLSDVVVSAWFSS